MANGTAEKIENGWRVKGNFGNASSNAAYSNGWLRPGYNYNRFNSIKSRRCSNYLCRCKGC